MIQTICDRKAKSLIVIAALLSISLVSCSDNGSSNSRTESSVIGNESGGSTVTTVDGAVIEFAPDGTPDIIEDPNGNAEVMENSNGGFTVNTDGATVTNSPDGSIINQAN